MSKKNTIKSSGFEQQLFNLYYRSTATLNHLLKQDELIKSKKLDVYYHIVSRRKNSNKWPQDRNNEILNLRFDRNLSHDFSLSHVDLKTGRSLTINLVSSEQPDYRDTKLSCHITHTNEEQELFTNRLDFYCKTLPGTIEKRLQHYKESLQKKWAEILEKYLAQGFDVNDSHIIHNMASFLHYENQRQEHKFISTYDIGTSINRILTIFSVLNGDCFHLRSFTNNANDHYDFHSRPYTGYCREHRDFQPVTLPAPQEEQLMMIVQLLKTRWPECKAAFDLAAVPFWSGPKFDYRKFKDAFRERFPEQLAVEP